MGKVSFVLLDVDDSPATVSLHVDLPGGRQ